jgi:hypothetical protein
MAVFTRAEITPIGQAFPMIFEVGDQGSLNLNAETVPLFQKNDEGINVPFTIRTDQSMPTFVFTPSREDALSASLRFLRAITTVAGNATWPLIRSVDAVAYPAQATGFQGFGAVADDANAVGYVNDSGVLTALTRQPFATFAAATANSFAIGANAALKFSDDLVAAKKLVGLSIPYPFTGGAALGTPLPSFKAVLTGVLNDTLDGQRKIFQVAFSRATVDLAQSGELTSGNPGQITIADLSGSCSLNIKYLKTQPSC